MSESNQGIGHVSALRASVGIGMLSAPYLRLEDNGMILS